MVPDFGNSLIVSAARYAVSNNVTVNIPLTYPAPSLLPTVSSNNGVGKVETVAPSPIVPTSTPAATLTPSIQPTPSPSPSILPDDSQGSAGDAGASENWLIVLIIAVVVGMLVLGYRLRRKQVVV